MILLNDIVEILPSHHFNRNWTPKTLQHFVDRLDLYILIFWHHTQQLLSAACHSAKKAGPAGAEVKELHAKIEKLA